MADSIHNGCPAFDEQLIDLAVQPVARPELEAHLATCERCRRAHEQYRETAQLVGAALTIGPVRPAPITPITRNTRKRRKIRIAQALAASALTAVAILLSSSPRPSVARTSMSVHPEAGTTVHLLGPDRALIQAGTSTFVISNSEMVVETPAGLLSCSDCEFTVEISECRNCPPRSLPACEPGPVCVTLFVAAGLVGSNIQKQLTPLGPGEILTWSVPANPLAALTFLP